MIEVIPLDFDEKGLKDFVEKNLDEIERSADYLNYPVIYILNGQKEAYIGETVHFQKRMKQHLKLKQAERKNVDQINLVKHETFNRSATFHLETKLINYFLGDEKYTLQNKSKTASDFTHNYHNKSFYDDQLFPELWSALHEKGLVRNELHAIENKDIFKLSPFKELSLEQMDLKERVLEFCETRIDKAKPEDMYGDLYVIEGEAGVGKSVVLSSIFNTIQARTNEAGSKLHQTENYLVVNHEEMLKTYKGIAKQVKHLKAGHFAKPTPLLNKLQDKKVDIILVDEAHLLLTKSDAYNNFRADNHLEELMKVAKVVIVIFDQHQVLKLKSKWNQGLLESFKQKAKHAETYQLTNQFRMQASEEVIDWINAFKDKRIQAFPESNDYELRVFDTLEQMHQLIMQRDKEHGLSRVVSTFDYLHKKDGETYYVYESNGEYKLPWNTTGGKTTWAEKSETIAEAGSIYTIQGFDLNYVGIVLGPSVTYDETKDCLVIDTNLYKDTGAYAGIDGVENVELAKEQIVLNSINILMKRGVQGLYLYASNQALRDKLLHIQKKRIQR
ncbi:endonuclease [Exiguobacterium sp. SH31]|nr:endonuclease [Exiguobacterium sp. SH31]